MGKLIAARPKVDGSHAHTAKKILVAFINHLKAQREKNLSTVAADTLIADAQLIISNL